MVFAFLSGQKIFLKEYFMTGKNYMKHVKSHGISVSINKALLEHSLAHSFCIVYGYFQRIE